MTDLRRVVRRLTQHDRAFALFTFLTLTLGLWVTTLIFGVASGLLLRPLPYRDSAELSRLVPVLRDNRVAHRDLVEEAAEAVRSLPSIASAALYESRGLNVSVGAEPLRLQGALAGPELFTVLDVAPSEGRLFTTEEQRRGEAVVVSDRLRQRAGWPRGGAVGQTIRVNGQPSVVVGVLPAGVRFPENAQLWLPLRPAAAGSAGSAPAIIVRVRSDASALETELGTVAERLGRDRSEPGLALRAASLNPLAAEGFGPLLSIAVGAALLVLLVVSINIAALMLARIAAREVEFAAMLTLGASRARVTRLVVLEAGILSGAAAAVGLTFTAWTLRLVPALLPVAELPEWMAFEVDRPTAAFAVLAAAGATLMTGVIPAASLPRRDLLVALRGTGRTTGGRRTATLQRRIVAAQLVGATILLIGGGSLARAYLSLVRSDVGYDPSGVYMLETELPPARYPSPENRVRFFCDTIDALERLGPISAAAVAGGKREQRGGTQGTGAFDYVRPLGTQIDGKAQRVEQVVVSSGFFGVLKLPLVEGRTFTANDTADLAVVNEAFARRYWPNGSAVGQFVEVADPQPRTMQIVGVVADVNDPFLAEGGRPETRPRLYLPIAFGISASATLYARATADRQEVGATMAGVVRQIDPDQPVWSVTSLESFLQTARAPVLWLGYLLATCALVALAVASVGIYGVVTYGLACRRREFGVRAALGARPAALLQLAMRQALVPAALGVLLGTPGGFALNRALSTIIFAIDSLDPAVVAVAGALLLLAATTASFPPGYRIARVEPAVLLRHD